MSELIKASVISRQQVDAMEAASAKLAEKLASNEALTTEIETAIKINQDDKKSTFGLHLTLMEMFTVEELRELPEVGSMAGQTDNFDLYRYVDLNGAKRNGSFWRKMAQDHPSGAKYMSTIAAIGDATKVNNAYTVMNDGQRKLHKKDATKAFDAFLTKMKDAFATFGAIDKANELPGVVVSYAETPELDDKGNIVYTDDKRTEISMIYADTTQPIRVGHKVRADVCQYYTIPNFLRLDPAKATLNGGTYEAFITSNNRDVEGPAGDGIAVDTFIQFESATAAATNWLEKVKANPAHIKMLLAQYRTTGSDDRLMTLFNLAEQLTIVTELPEFKSRYEKLVIDGYSGPVKAAA